MPDRAVVAISEDRQWLVVLLDRPELHSAFQIFEFVDTPEHYGYFSFDCTEDTGQSADEVLAAFLEGRGG